MSNNEEDYYKSIEPITWDPSESREIPKEAQKKLDALEANPNIIAEESPPKRELEGDVFMLLDKQPEQLEIEPESVSSKTEHTEPSIEDQARKDGWLPKEEWAGDPAKWRDAKTYIENGSFFKKINEQNKTIKAILETLAKSEERNYKKALAEIQQKQAVAETLNDVKAYKEASQQVDALNQQYKDLGTTVKQSTPGVSEDAISWKEKNKHIIADNSEKGMAVKQDMELASISYHKRYANSPNYSEKAELEYVDKVARSLHPDYEPFAAESKQSAPPKVSAVGGIKSSATSSSKPRGFDDRIAALNPIAQQVAKRLKASKMDWETYVKEVEKQR